MAINKIKKIVLPFLQPLLIAIYPAIFIFINNTHEIDMVESFVGLTVLIAISVFFVLFFGLIYKSLIKGSLFSSCLLLFLFYFLYPVKLIWYLESYGAYIRSRHLFIFFCLLLLILFIRLFRSKKKSYFFSNFLIIPFCGLIIWNLLIFACDKRQFYSFSREYDRVSDQIYRTSDECKKAIINEKDKSKLPNIFFIILDCYAGKDTLKRVFDHDNSNFLEKLSDQGFYVASNSCSNYTRTVYSLPATLNMRYYPSFKLFEKYSSALKGKTFINKFLSYLGDDNFVVKCLKSKGYKYLHLSSGCGFTLDSSLADELYKYSNMTFRGFTRFHGFTRAILSNAIFYPFVDSFYESLHGEWILYQLRKLKEISELRGPNFVFAHVMCPHDPYVFDEDGNMVSNSTYVQQLKFLNKEIIKVVDTILKKSEVEPIIILQADHGPGNDELGGLYTKNGIPLQFSILNAYYLPGKSKEKLYSSISPVNNFRFIFNEYFDENFELLEDRCYYGPLDKGIHDFIQVDLFDKNNNKN